MGFLKFGKIATKFMFGGLIKFAKKPSLRTLPSAAFDVGSTFFPIGKVGKAAKFIKPASKFVFKTTRRFTPKIIKKHPIKATIGGLLAYGVLKESPTARAKTKEVAVGVVKSPKTIVAFGGDIGKVIEKEKTFGKEDIKKGFAAAGIIGGTAAAGIVIVPKVIEKIKDRKEKVAVNGQKTFVSPFIEPERQIVKDKPVGIQGLPQTPQTQTISTGKRRVKRRRAKKTPSVRQSVRVNVYNRSTGLKIQNKRYINQDILR